MTNSSRMLQNLNHSMEPSAHDIVTFISENYTPGEAGHLICPACLTETPNILSICIRCHGTLVSWGEKEAEKDESTAPGMPERERHESGDGQDADDEDVEMENEDQEEIDRLVRESKKNTEEAPDDDVDMTDARSSHENVRPEEERRRNVPDQKVVFGDNTKEHKRRKMRRLPKNKTRMKNAGKRGCGCLCGRQESSKLHLFSASTLPRTRMPSTAQLARWTA